MLFFKECRKVLFSLTFFLYLLAVGGFYFTQFAPEIEKQLLPPSPNEGYYGVFEKETPEVLMPSAAESLVSEYLRGYYIAYPLGFYKEVKLPEKKTVQIAEIITEITGISRQELDSFADYYNGEFRIQPDENGEWILAGQQTTLPEIQIPNTMTYEHFREQMKRADKLIGGGSKYGDAFIVENFSKIPRTYEDALADYNERIEKDKITGAYARLFCDYMGIVVSILPVFAATSLSDADRKARMEQIVYARKISSAKLICTRFLALAAVLILPVLVLSAAATIQVQAVYPGSDLDLLAISRLSIYWLIPNILFATAFGMFLTELLSPLLAAFLQGTIWVSSNMGGAGRLTGGIGRFTLVCRHNSLSDRYLFMENLNNFRFNRVFYTALSLVLVALTICIYNLKRKGDFHVIRKPSKNSASQPEA